MSECSFNDSTTENQENCINCFNEGVCDIGVCKTACGYKNDYEEVFEKIKEINNSLEDTEKLDIKFYNLSKTNESEIKNSLREAIKKLYQHETDKAEELFKETKKINNMIDAQESVIDGKNMINYKSEASLSKRKMEINLNAKRNLKYNVRVLKHSIIFVAFMIIIPTLTEFDVLDKMSGMVLWFCLFLSNNDLYNFYVSCKKS